MVEEEKDEEGERERERERGVCVWGELDVDRNEQAIPSTSDAHGNTNQEKMKRTFFKKKRKQT